MTQPVRDLSGLRIDRDQPSAGSRRALKLTVWLAVVAAVLIAGTLWWLRASGVTEVQVARAEVAGGGSGGVGITANGYVVARTKASVSSRIAGRLAYLGVSEGSVVRRGDVLARLDNDDYRAILAQAQAGLSSAQAALREVEAQRDQLARDLARARDLREANLTSEQNVEDLAARLAASEARVEVQEAQVEAAEASIGVADANLENTYIRAPFSGTVLRKDAEVGEVVAPVATGGGLTRGAVVTMADLETLEVEVDVNEAYIAQIEGGQPARIVLDAYPSNSYRGAVRQIVPTADRQRATVLVKVSFLERDDRILPEMSCRVDFLDASTQDSTVQQPARIFVPAGAVRESAGESVVWVVREGIVVRTVVDAGPVSGGRREVREGLTGGEQVVLDAPDTLREGQAVRVVPSQ